MYFEDEEWDGLENLKQPFTPAFANRNRFTYIKDGERLRAHAHATALNKAQVPPSPAFPLQVICTRISPSSAPEAPNDRTKKGQPAQSRP